MTIVFLREYFNNLPNYLGTHHVIPVARRWNPNTRVVLIGDEAQPKNLCEFHPIEKYCDLKRELKQYYQHRNGLEFNFIWCNISAWVVIYEFCIKNNLTEICHLDTDVLAFCDVAKEAEWLRGCDYTISNPEGHIQAPIFIFNLERLKGFVDFLFKLYKGELPETKDILSGPQCCMSLWHWYRRLDPIPHNIIDTTGVFNGATWDHNMALGYHGYEHDGVGKVMRFWKGQPYCLRGNERIRFNCLHMWGPYKNRVEEFRYLSEKSSCF